jgi:hypothetical protein
VAWGGGGCWSELSAYRHAGQCLSRSKGAGGSVTSRPGFGEHSPSPPSHLPLCPLSSNSGLPEFSPLVFSSGSSSTTEPFLLITIIIAAELGNSSGPRLSHSCPVKGTPFLFLFLALSPFPFQLCVGECDDGCLHLGGRVQPSLTFLCTGEESGSDFFSFFLFLFLFLSK